MHYAGNCRKNIRDLIPPIFLRECAQSLAKPLSIIYSKSVDGGKHPDKFKISELSAIYKNGKKNEVTNYRGTAIMPNLAKVFERIMYEQVKLIINPNLKRQQHGFVSNRNIETNLMEFSQFTHTAYEMEAQVDTFFPM